LPLFYFTLLYTNAAKENQRAAATKSPANHTEHFSNAIVFHVPFHFFVAAQALQKIIIALTFS